MQQVFVELYNYRPAWLDASADDRRRFASGVAGAVEQLERAGVEVVGYGPNDPDTDRRAPYDFFCVYKVPSARLQRAFETEVAKSGWYDYFEQVNVSGPAYSAVGGLSRNVALAAPGAQPEPISATMPFAKKTVDVDGLPMAYVDEGAGRPVVFLHGDMMSSYLWRNVIPHVAGGHRCVALDLIGMGDSAKVPDATGENYSFEAHSRYLDGFLAALGLEADVAFVGHDWGANLAVNRARRHPGSVRALAFSEPLLPPFTWDRWPAPIHDLFRLIRSPEGEARVLETNLVVEGAQGSILRKLSDAERAEHRRPFRDPGQGRLPTHAWLASVPLDGSPARMAEIIDADVAFLAASPMPKLFVDARPGALVDEGRRAMIRGWDGVTEVTVSGLHWPPEDSPHEIGRAVASWLGAS